MNERNHSDHQSFLLHAIEHILATPAEIKLNVQKLKQRYGKEDNKPWNTLNKVANKLIAVYSTKAGLAGGATAMIGIIPGLGTVVRVFGGTTADIALCLKYQIEMSMALADLYGQDIENEYDKKTYFIIAGLGTINTEGYKQGGEQAAKLFTRTANRYLQNASQDTVKILFRKVGITLSKKALQKAIPFGIGAVIGFSSNKVLTWMVGQKVKAYFAAAAKRSVSYYRLIFKP